MVGMADLTPVTAMEGLAEEDTGKNLPFWSDVMGACMAQPWTLFCKHDPNVYMSVGSGCKVGAQPLS